MHPPPATHRHPHPHPHPLTKKLKEIQRQRAKAPLAAEFEECLQIFTRLPDIIRARYPENHDLSALADDCMEKLKDWGQESGASSRALDYILKSSPLVMKQTRRLLKDLHAALDQALFTIRSRDEMADPPGEIEGASAEMAGNNNDEVPDDQEPEMSTEDCLDETADIIECLTRLLPALWDPLEENDYSTPSPSYAMHSSTGYAELARMLFPIADDQLVKRLGECNWRRRQYLLRLRERSNALEEEIGLRSTGYNGPFRDWFGYRMKRTRRKVSSYQASDWNNYEGSEDDSATQSRIDTVSSWPGLAEQQSMATSITETPNHPILRQLVPLSMPPTYPDMEPECPICRFDLPLTLTEKATLDTRDWESHLYSDLQPYMCTFGKCNRDNRPFGNKRDWFQHEMDIHRSKVVSYCGGCRLDFEAGIQWKNHLYECHPSLSQDNLDALLLNCKRYSEGVASEPLCKLCGYACESMEILKDHLGNHLETFALACLLDFNPVDDDLSDEGDLMQEYLSGLDETSGVIPAVYRNVAAPMVTQEVIAQDLVMPARLSDLGHISHLEGGEEELALQSEQQYLEKVNKYLQYTQPPQDLNSTKRHNVPARDDNFVGRKEDLDQIHAALSTPGRVCTISGRPGVGKTATAVEHVYADAEYSYVFWVEAEQPGTCADTFNAIATRLDFGGKRLPEGISQTWVIRDHLAKLEKRWLIVFDNVDSWADISRYIPRTLKTSKGSVLVTTRNGPRLEVQSWHHQIPVRLDVWPLEHGREFLLTSINPRLRGRDLREEDDFEVAGQVVQKVGRLPLAISMMVGYVRVSKCELSDFLEMWEEIESRRAHKTDKVSQDGFDNTIAWLWEIGIREVQVNCRRLLDILSFFDPERIQKSLLVGRHKEEYLEDLSTSESSLETLSYKRMITQLSGRRLITVQKLPDGDVAYSMHRLLKKMINDVMGSYERAQALRSAFRLLRQQYPPADPTQVPVPKNWEICRKLMPHIFSFHQVFRSDTSLAIIADPQPVELAELFYDAAFYVLTHQTTNYEGMSFLETADEILDRINMSQNVKLRADINCVAGLLLLNKGCLERNKSKARLQTARAAREKLYEEDPSEANDILLQNASSDYCIGLIDDHEFEEAARIWEKCIERYKLWGPEESNPFEYSKYRGQISFIHMWRGDFDLAIENAEKCMENIEKFAGKQTQYYRRVYQLACILLQAGRLQEALDKHLEALNGRLEIHGKYDLGTIQSMYAVAAMYHYWGDTNTAIEYLKQCLECSKNPQITKESYARCQYHLAILYEEQGVSEKDARYLKEEAKKVIEECRQFAAECLRDSDNDMMILDDLQGTFQGRYTGRQLLPYLQKHAKQGKAASGS